jgi:hypothetical protein
MRRIKWRKERTEEMGARKKKENEKLRRENRE